MNTQEPFIEHWLNNETVRAVQAAKRLTFKRCVEAMIEDGFARPRAEEIAAFLKNKQPSSK